MPLTMHAEMASGLLSEVRVFVIILGSLQKANKDH